MNYLEVVGPVLLGGLTNIPLFLAWLVGIVLAVRMLRRGGGKAEKLLLVGCSLMCLSQIAQPFLGGLAIWLAATPGMSRASAVGLIVSLPLAVLNMSGILCLIFAFWTRWRTSSATTQ